VSFYQKLPHISILTLSTAILFGCGGGNTETQFDSQNSNTNSGSNTNTGSSSSTNTDSSTTGPDGNTDSNSKLDTELRDVISLAELTGDPSVGRNLPNIKDKLPQLGKLLFFSKALGGDKDSACVTCHHPALGGGDDLSLAIGVAAVNPDQLGPGRTHDTFALGWDGGPTMPRNVPSIFNVGMWDQAMFWEGRLNSMGKTPKMNGGDGAGIRTPDTPLNTADENAGDTLPVALARFPVTVNEEMRGFAFEAGKSNDAVRNHLAARLGNYGIGAGELQVNNWLPLFEKAFNSDAPLSDSAQVTGTSQAETLITYANISKAIGEYGRSQVFVNSPWKAYVLGNNSAITESAKRGALLFFNPVTTDVNPTTPDSPPTLQKIGAGCASCHSGDFFTDEQTHVVAIPQIGRGKGDGVFGDDDFGRFRETADPTDKYAFRTPTLLNVTSTGPWGHSGAYETLEGIVRHHLNVEQAVAEFDYSQLTQQGIQIEHAVVNTQKAVNQLVAKRNDDAQSGTNSKSLQNVNLTDLQVSDLLAFLEALTDPCVEDRQCLAPWIPNDNDPDPDDLRIKAVDFNNKPL